jgi:uncharacterized tellurite resistance protein B-like protein
MKKIFKIVLLFVLVIFTSPAFAKVGIPIPVPYSKKEELHRIPAIEVKVPGEEGMDLGYKTTGMYLFGVIGIGIMNDGYVLIPKYSDNSYSKINKEEIKLFKELEMLPKDLPRSPSMSFGVVLKGFLMWFILLGLALVVFKISQVKKVKKKELDEMLSHIGSYERLLIDVMGLMALSDGKIEDEEIEAITKIYKQLSDNKVDKYQVRKVLEFLDKDQSISEYAKGIVSNLEEDKRILLIKAAVLVAVSDGEFAKKEIDFIGELSSGLAIEEEQVLTVFREMGLATES